MSSFLRVGVDRKAATALYLILVGVGLNGACSGKIGEAGVGEGGGAPGSAGPGTTTASGGSQSGPGTTTSAGPGGGSMTGPGAGGGTSAATTGGGGDPTGGAGGSPSGSSASTSVSASSVAASSSSGGSPTDMLCARWKGDRADLSMGAWSGSVNGCNAGDIPAAGRAKAVKLVNLYRFIAGLPEVTNDATKDAKAQECALMMTANNQLSHSPPANWACYSANGATAAGSSNIASTSAVTAVDLYMADPGNPTTIGHRRWILSGPLGPIGIGSSDNYSCMWVFGGNGQGSQPYTAWPSAGLFPIQAMNASFSSVDANGWTIQSDGIDLSNAQVTITDGGQNKPVTVTQLGAGYGSAQAIRILPQGWTSQAGHTYSVSVSGASQAINYTVEMVDCN